MSRTIRELGMNPDLYYHRWANRMKSQIFSVEYYYERRGKGEESGKDVDGMSPICANL